MEIIEHPAQQLSARTEENFEEFTRRMARSTMRPLQYGDGTKIEIKPERILCFLGLELESVATPELFENLCTAIMTQVKQFEAKGLLPKDWVKRVGTPMDITPPSIPKHFIDDVNASGGAVKTLLNGNTFR